MPGRGGKRKNSGRKTNAEKSRLNPPKNNHRIASFLRAPPAAPPAAPEHNPPPDPPPVGPQNRAESPPPQAEPLPALPDWQQEVAQQSAIDGDALPQPMRAWKKTCR